MISTPKKILITTNTQPGFLVIPAKAGIQQHYPKQLDPRLRGDDDLWQNMSLQYQHITKALDLQLSFADNQKKIGITGEFRKNTHKQL